MLVLSHDRKTGNLSMMPRPTVVGIGEILWDLFPDGPRFGGAPANFACSVAELARDRIDVYMAGGVGADDLGRRAIESLHDTFDQHQANPEAALLGSEKRFERHAFLLPGGTDWRHVHWRHYDR